MNTTQKIFSHNLKCELEARQISQSALARAINVSQPTVNEWLKGDSLPSLNTFRLLCIFLKADANIILDLDEEAIKIPWPEIPGLTD